MSTLRQDQPTPRELEVLELLLAGQLTNVEIAESMTVSPHTVHWHLRNLMARWGVRSRAGVLNYAYQHGTIDQGQWRPHQA